MPWNQTTVRLTGFLVNAQVWEDEVVENFKFLEEIDRVKFETPLTVTATSEGTAQTVVTLPAITYEAVPHEIVFSAPSARASTSAAATLLTFSLYDGGTHVSVIGQITNPVSGQSTRSTICIPYPFTPSAGSHTYLVKVWVSSGTGALVDAGTGLAGALAPGFLSVRRVPTAP